MTGSSMLRLDLAAAESAFSRECLSVSTSSHEIARWIPEISSNEMVRAGLSDLAVNNLREAAREAHWTPSDLQTMMREEARRIMAAELTPDIDGLLTYKHMPRSGSKFRTSRATRACIFAQIACKGLLNARSTKR